MTERALIAQYLQGRMVTAFERGRLDEAQHLEAFLSRVETLTDEEYEDRYHDGDVVDHAGARWS